jgi:putative endonuclease
MNFGQKMQIKQQNKIKGNLGEQRAAELLKRKGYHIIATQWKSLRFEIDIIAEKGNEIVFVEVKTRTSEDYGQPWEAVKRDKRRKICNSADQYIRMTKCDKEPRFDIISIIQTEDKTKITHLKSAFRPTL